MSAAGWARLRERAESGDYEATAVLVILDIHRFRAKADPYVTPEGGIDFHGLLGECACSPPRSRGEVHDEDCPVYEDAPYLSAGERLLVELASNLWRGWPRVDVNGLLATLDGPHLRLALDAIDARSGGKRGVAVADDRTTKAVAAVLLGQPMRAMWFAYPSEDRARRAADILAADAVAAYEANLPEGLVRLLRAAERAVPPACAFADCMICGPIQEFVAAFAAVPEPIRKAVGL